MRKTKANGNTLMTQNERNQNERRLKTLYQALHLSVIYEDNFLINLKGSFVALLAYRDDLLDKINVIRCILGDII